MKNTTFKLTLAQYKSEVPFIVKTIYRVLQFISVAMGVLILYINIPVNIKLDINSGLLIGNKLIYEFCQFFGIPQPSDSMEGDENSLAPIDKAIEKVKRPAKRTAS